ECTTLHGPPHPQRAALADGRRSIHVLPPRALNPFRSFQMLYTFPEHSGQFPHWLSHTPPPLTSTSGDRTTMKCQVVDEAPFSYATSRRETPPGIHGVLLARCHPFTAVTAFPGTLQLRRPCRCLSLHTAPSPEIGNPGQPGCHRRG